MHVYSALGFALATVALTEGAFSWSNVNIGGGGGFIPGIVFNPTAKGVAYARTDIGGLYKLNPDDSWTPLTEKIAQDETWHNWGVDAVATDPVEPNRVYAALGLYTNSWDPSNGSIARSSDYGTTWSFSNLPFKVGGNMPGRGMGERLAIDPNNNSVIYFGARSGNGLWRSTDRGVSFHKVSSFTAVGSYAPDSTDSSGIGSDLQGIAWITFDSTSGALGATTPRIFVGTAEKTTSVYVSNDAGATWQPVPGQPSGNLPHKCKLQPKQKLLYLTYSNTSGPYDGGTGSVHKYNITSGIWTDITPVKGSDLTYGFGGVGLDMLKPGTLVVASLNSWWPDLQLFRSNDSGATWSRIWEWTNYPAKNLYYSYNTKKAPWIDASRQSDDSKVLGWMVEALEIDPHDSDHWLYGTGLTMYGGHDLTKWDTVHNVTIESLAVGIEETAVQDVISIPGGPALLAATGDVGGFTFESNLRASPQIGWVNPLFSTNTGVDYAGNKPKSVVRVGNGNGSPQAAHSTDGGRTWSIDSAAQAGPSGGKVAYSADADVVLWSTSSSGVLRSQQSKSYSAISSLPSGAIIASDKRNNTVFYGGSAGSFYRSLDSAATFSQIGSLGAATEVRDIVVNPVLAGDVWVSTNKGLFHSTNYGLNFSQPSTVLTNTQQIDLGKGNGSYWNIYAFGVGPAGPKLYSSVDSGATWSDVQGSQSFGAISSTVLAASKDTLGLVFVGTNGRGVFFSS